MRPRLAGLTGALWVVIVVLVLAAVAAVGLLADRQDPTLSVPGEGGTSADEVPATGADTDVGPVAPELPTN